MSERTKMLQVTGVDCKLCKSIGTTGVNISWSDRSWTGILNVQVLNSLNPRLKLCRLQELTGRMSNSLINTEYVIIELNENIQEAQLS